MILSDALEDLRDAHLAALDGALWEADSAVGPNAQRTRDALGKFQTIYNALFRRLKELENEPV